MVTKLLDAGALPSRLQRLSPGAGLTAGVVSLGLLMAVVVVAFTLASRRLDLEIEQSAMERKAQVTSRVLAEHAERALRHADLIGRFTGERWLEQGKALDLVKLAADNAFPMDIFLQVAVVDAKGIVAGSTVPGWKPVDLAFRDHIKVHFGADRPPYFISKPLVGKVSNRPSVQFSKPILDRAGQLSCIVVISLNPEYFANYFKEFDLGPDGSVTLLGMQDRTVRMRYVGNQPATPLNFELGDSPLARQLQSGRSGSGEFVSGIDGHRRYFAFDPVDSYGLVATVGLDIDYHLAGHAARTADDWQRAYVGLFAIALVTLSGVLLVRRWSTTREQHRAAQQAGELLRQRLASVIEAAPDGVLLGDADGRVLSANHAFLALAGCTPGQAVGQPLVACLDQLRRQQDGLWSGDFDAWLASVLGHAAAPAPLPNIELRRTQEPRRVLEVRPWPLAEGGVTILVSDITTEREVHQMKMELVTTAAHELRTPMASVLGFSELLLQGELEELDQREALGTIHRQAERLTALLNDFLDFARMEARAGKDFKAEPVDLGRIANEVAAEFSYLDMHREIRLDVQADVFVRGDRTRLTQLVQNLVSNALKYSTAPAPVALRVRADDDERHARLEVEDRGIGMTPYQVERAFDAFYRADSSGATVGTGLGLALARRIAQAHGGRLELRSEAGRGTVVTLTLPLIDPGTVGQRAPAEVAAVQ